MNSFQALRIHQAEKTTAAKLEKIAVTDLTPGEVQIRVQWSGINYKDALAVSGPTGGVGSIAIDLFKRAGFTVHAVTGKAPALPPEEFEGWIAARR